MDLTKSKKELQRHAKDLGQEYVDFFTGLWDVQESIEPLEWEPKDTQALTDAAKAGAPMFSLEAPVMTAQYLFENLAKVARYIADKVSSFDAYPRKIEQILEAGDEAPLLSTEALSSIFLDQSAAITELAEALDIETDSADFEYLRLALSAVLEPTAHAAAAKVDVPEITNFKEALCPVCGSPSPVGVHKDAGVNEGSPREMWCSLCGINYRFYRIACTRCGNKSQEELGYSFAEGDDAHRIYTCTSCLGTQKIVLETGLKYVPDPRAEGLAMVELEEQVQEALFEAAEENAE